MHTTMNRKSAGVRSAGEGSLRVRRVKESDISQVVALDQRVTRLAKPEYWRDIYARYGRRRLTERFFLIAERIPVRRGQRILGFVIGEIRAWEFGSAPCGWVFAMSVEPEAPESRSMKIEDLLRFMVKQEASDLHVKPMRPPLFCETAGGRRMDSCASPPVIR